MAKKLKKIFDPGIDEVVQNFTIESWHVSQSIDAFRGDDDYDITISGSLTISGSTFISGSPEASGVGFSTLVLNNTTGQVHVTGSYGGGGSVNTGSFYISSSVSNATITFTQGDNTTEQVTVDNVNSASFALTSSHTPDALVTASLAGSNLTFTKGDSSQFTLALPGGGGTPGGSNTHVQFNQLGAFGGDAGLTYVSASQILTVNKSTTPTPVSPNIFLLGNSSTAGAISGVIAGSATTQNTAPASIQFKNAVAHGLGDFGTDVLIKTAFSDGFGNTVERTAVNFTASGDTHFGFDIFAPNLDNTVQENVVGFNSTTGKITRFNTSSLVNSVKSALASTFTTSSVYTGGSQITFSPTSSYNVYNLTNNVDSGVTITLTKNANLAPGSQITLAVNFIANNFDGVDCTLTIRFDQGASDVDLLFNSGVTARHVGTFTAHDFNGGGFINNGFAKTS